MDCVYRLSSSLRTQPPEKTLEHARVMAAALGISRVTDITRLDRIGVPVYASIRPGARPGSLCVNAGKGLSPLEAKVGAYMEAIEFAFAEYGRSSVQLVPATAQDVLDGRLRPEAILDFCPVIGTEIPLHERLMCVEAEEIVSGERHLIPAELIFHPSDPEFGACYFGCSSNGLSSGNTVLEATVHGLAEVMERDVRSFQMIKDTAASVPVNSLPASLKPVVRAIEDAGLMPFVKYLDNVFHLPYFSAAVAEVDSMNPIYVSGGYACHPIKEIAVTRALCEALQSRLSFIHGARDDLTNHHLRFSGMDFNARAVYAQDLIAQVAAAPTSVDFAEIPQCVRRLNTLEATLEVLISSLRTAGITRVCRVIFTTPTHPLQVVRVVVPGLEFFTETAPRLGFRLRDHVQRS